MQTLIKILLLRKKSYKNPVSFCREKEIPLQLLRVMDYNEITTLKEEKLCSITQEK